MRRGPEDRVRISDLELPAAEVIHHSRAPAGRTGRRGGPGGFDQVAAFHNPGPVGGRDSIPQRGTDDVTQGGHRDLRGRQCEAEIRLWQFGSRPLDTAVAKKGWSNTVDSWLPGRVRGSVEGDARAEGSLVDMGPTPAAASLTRTIFNTKISVLNIGVRNRCTNGECSDLPAKVRVLGLAGHGRGDEQSSNARSREEDAPILPARRRITRARRGAGEPAAVLDVGHLRGARGRSHGIAVRRIGAVQSPSLRSGRR
jgi:hypothetical protein